VLHNTIWDSPFIKDTEKKDLERLTDPETWSCEYLAEYNDKIGQVYWEFNPIEKTLDIDPTTNVIMRVRGLDWGLDDNTGCAYIALLPDNRVHIYDEHVENNLDVPEQATRIKNKTIIPVAWTCLDSSCWNRLPGVESVARRFMAAGIPVMPATKDFDGSTSDMKVMFSNGKITVSPKCTRTLQAIQEYQWGQHEPDILAALRYGVNGLIRAGKLLRPASTAKPTMLNHIQQYEETEKRMAKLNAALAHKAKHGPMQSFRIYDKMT